MAPKRSLSLGDEVFHCGEELTLAPKRPKSCEIIFNNSDRPIPDSIIMDIFQCLNADTLEEIKITCRTYSRIIAKSNLNVLPKRLMREIGIETFAYIIGATRALFIGN